MATTVRIFDKIIREAKFFSKVDNRFVTGQIEP